MFIAILSHPLHRVFVTMDDEITEHESWEVIQRYFKSNGLVNQQIESFNNFIDSLPQIAHHSDIEVSNSEVRT